MPVVLAVLLVLSMIGTAFDAAADQLMPGQKLVLKAPAGRPARMVWSVKSASLTPPAPTSADDPTSGGATLTLSAQSGETASRALPAGKWRHSGRGAE
jgi:hypothetical protein